MGWVNLYQSFEPLMSLGKNLSHFIKQALFHCLLEVVGISVLWVYSGMWVGMCMTRGETEREILVRVSLIPNSNSLT